MRSPLIGFWNFTPSSVILRNLPKLNTWKPPLSVKIGRCHCIKSCKSPCLRITSCPGRSHRWNVLPSKISAPVARTSSGVMPFTVP